MSVLIINGPNLNLLGHREQNIYGKITLADINEELLCFAQANDTSINFFQSNHEGKIIDIIHETSAKIIVINPGAYGHTSIAIRDAFLSTQKPFIEIHLSNVYNRENFRNTSLISSIAKGCIFGFGPSGYKLALIEAIRFINNKGD